MASASPPLTAPTVGAAPPASRALVPVLVFIGMVVAVVSSLGAPLVPTIASADGVSLASAQWSLTIALLLGAVATPTMGRLGDGPHRRRVVLVALSLVVVGSVLAALPLGFGWLVAGRALQGVGLGLTPLTIVIARDALPPERSTAVVALLSVTTVAGVGLGYPLTGFLSEHLSFHAGFWFGAVIAVLALGLAAVVLPSSSARPGARLDVVGAVLLGAGVAGLVLALAEAEQWGWTSLRLALVAGASTSLLVVWVVHERRTDAPLVDLSLLRSRSVLTADAVALFAGIGMYLLMSMVTRFVQTPTSSGYGLGASVVVAGLVLLPFSVASVAASRVAPLVARRFGGDAVLPVGCAVFLVAMGTFALLRGALWEMFLVMALAGLGVGCTFSAMPGLIVRSVPASETGSAMSFNQVLRTIGFSTGSALSATVLEAFTPAGSALPRDSGYTVAAVVGCGLWVLTGVLAVVLPRGGDDGPVGAVLVQESLDAAVAGELLLEPDPRSPAAAR